MAKNLDPGLKYFSLVTFGYVGSVGHGLEFALSKKFCLYKIERDRFQMLQEVKSLTRMYFNSLDINQVKSS